MAIVNADLATARAEAVLEASRRIIEDACQSDWHRRKLWPLLAVGARQVSESPLMPAVQLPLLAHESVRPLDERALELAGICLLSYLAIDAFDNVADREVPPEWDGMPQSDVLLSASSIFAGLVYKRLAELQAWGAAAEVANALWQMSYGQFLDMTPWQSDEPERTSLRERYLQTAQLKAGRQFELYAALGAAGAGAEESTLSLVREFALNLGIAGQLTSDCADFFLPAGGKDIENGKLTLPIALLSEVGDGDIASALQDIERHIDDLRAEARRRGILTLCFGVIACYRARARSALESLTLPAPSRDVAHSMLDFLAARSLFGGA